MWVPIHKPWVATWHRLGFRTRIGPEPGVWKVWVEDMAGLYGTPVQFREDVMARRRADEVNRWVVIVVLGTEIWSEEFATSEGAEACRRHFEGVEGAKIEVIEDVAG